MSNEAIITNVFISAGLIFIVWWLAGVINEPMYNDIKNPIVITVSRDSFQPALIQVPAGTPFTLHFQRADNSGCSSAVVFPQLNMTYQLQQYQKVEVKLPGLARGEWEFSCPQGLNRGKIIVT